MEHILLLTDSEARMLRYMLADIDNAERYKQLDHLCKSMISLNILTEDMPQTLKDALEEFNALKSLSVKIKLL